VNNLAWTDGAESLTYLLPVSAKHNRILHVDGDSFFASCEIALDSSLEGRPVWVGGGRTGDGFVIAANRDQIVETFTIITTEPNPMAAKVHNRMPVIIGSEHYSWWLEPKFEPEFLKTLLRPYPAKKRECRQVSSVVNNTRNDGPECVSPVGST
jgi:hypothetical protein